MADRRDVSKLPAGTQPPGKRSMWCFHLPAVGRRLLTVTAVAATLLEHPGPVPASGKAPQSNPTGANKIKKPKHKKTKQKQTRTRLVAGEIRCGEKKMNSNSWNYWNIPVQCWRQINFQKRYETSFHFIIGETITLTWVRFHFKKTFLNYLYARMS